MSLIEGIGDEVTHFFLCLFVAAVAYIAWWSTNISEQRQFRTVLLLDRRRNPNRALLRIRVPPRQLTNHTEAVTISEGTSSNNTTSVQTEHTALIEAMSEASGEEQQSSDPMDTSTGNANDNFSLDEHNSENGIVENTVPLATIHLEESDIIETMDADTQNELRRRLVQGPNEVEYVSSTEQILEDNLADSSETATTSRPENSNFKDSCIEAQSANEDVSNDCESSVTRDENSINIRLKYLDDNIRLVDGRLKELLRDFKQRHFTEDINANKEIKLIFNGKILKEDGHNLESCGLFDNCVVHCLVHEKRSTRNNIGQQEYIDEFNHILRDDPVIGDRNANNNNQGLDWDAGNFLFALVSFILLAAWYFRYLYAHLYTVTATIGLIICTGVFSVVLFGTFFPDNHVPQGPFPYRVQFTTRTGRAVDVQ